VERPVPQASVEFEVADADTVQVAADELKDKGFTLLHDARTEPWGTDRRSTAVKGGCDHRPLVRARDASVARRNMRPKAEAVDGSLRLLAQPPLAFESEAEFAGNPAVRVRDVLGDPRPDHDRGLPFAGRPLAAAARRIDRNALLRPGG